MSEWLTKDLESVANIAIGGTPSRGVAKYWAVTDGDGECWVSIADLRKRIVESSKERITLDGVNSSNVKRVPAGTLIMSFKLSIGRAAIAGCDLYTNEAIAAIIPKHGEIEAEYLYYILPPKAANAITDTAVKGSTLNKKTLGKLSLTYPKEGCVQKKIANILQTIDEAIEQTEALIEKYSLVKAGMMHDLFTRGLTPDGKLRPSREEAPDLYKETPMGWIPKEWEYDLLDKSTDRRSGHTPSKSFPEYWNGGVKWVSLADSHRLDRLYIDDTDFEISTLGLQNSSAVLLPAGMVIMSRDAGIGKSAITTKPMAVSQHFMAWQCGDKMDKYFLYYWLQIKKRMFENIAMGSTILTIGLSYFKRLKIAAPSDLDEQEQIGKRLKQADTHLFSLEAELNKLKKQKSGLMHDLLTGEVPVNVEEPEVAHV